MPMTSPSQTFGRWRQLGFAKKLCEWELPTYLALAREQVAGEDFAVGQVEYRNLVLHYFLDTREKIPDVDRHFPNSFGHVKLASGKVLPMVETEFPLEADNRKDDIEDAGKGPAT